jgi:hypothetical protein
MSTQDEQIEKANALARSMLGEQESEVASSSEAESNCKPAEPVEDGIYYSGSISQLAAQTGRALRDVNVFQFGEGYVTADSKTGDLSGLDPLRFCSWVEKHLYYYRLKEDQQVIVSLGKDNAAKILGADQFRDEVRPLLSVNSARLPVRRADGALDLLEPGYDSKSQIFTAPAIVYDTDWSLEQSKAWLAEIYGQFPWNEDGSDIFKKRSFAAHIAASVGTFCRSLFPPATPKPMIVYNGNQPGTGKSLLMRCALAPIYGMTEENSKSKDDNELRKVLDTATIARRPYLCLDDVAYLNSNDLNSFITSPVHSPRVLGHSRSITCPNVTQVFSTGNGLKVTPDLERRALIVDLFEPGRALEKQVNKPITTAWLWQNDTRAKFLAALWGLVSHWKDQGCPMHRQANRQSFELYSQTVGSIMIEAGLCNPFEKRECALGGDEEGRALEMLLAELVGALTEPKSFTAAEITEQASQRGYLDSIFPYVVKDTAKALGQRLKKLKGRHLIDSRGRKYEWGKRTVSAGALYEVNFITHEQTTAF